jgi:hypothetical protein
VKRCITGIARRLRLSTLLFLCVISSLFLDACYSFIYYEPALRSEDLSSGSLRISTASVDYLLACHGDFECLKKVGATREVVEYYETFRPSDSGIEYICLEFDYWFHDSLSTKADSDGLYFEFPIKSLSIEQGKLLDKVKLDSLLIVNKRYDGHNILSIEPLPYRKSIAEATRKLPQTVDCREVELFGILQPGGLYETITIQ